MNLLTPETIKLLGSTKSEITKDENSDNMSYSEITEVIFHCNFINNDYEHDSRILYIFIPNKLFSQLLDIFCKTFIFLKTFNSESSYIEAWFADQNCKSLEIEDKINITLVINQSVKYKKWWPIQCNLEIEYL